MKSLVFWYEAKGNGGDGVPAELQLHFNHWKLRSQENKKGRASEYILDVGLRVKNGLDIKSICIYLPEVLKSKIEVLEDLGGKLKDPKLLTAIFNEKYSSNSKGNQKYFEAQNGGITELYIYTLDVNSDVSLTNSFNGTILKIPFAFFNDADTYYRLRLKTVFVANLSHIYRPKNNFFESISSSIELIDFRVNDTRDTDISLLEHITNLGKSFRISLIHLFVMRDISDDYLLSDFSLNSVRLLEEGVWNTYMANSDLTYSKSLAYHLKAKAIEQGSTVKYIEDFNALIKFKFEDSQLERYLGYAVLFAVTTAVIGNIITRALQLNLHLLKDYIFSIVH